MLSSIYSRFKSRRLFRFSLSILAIALFGLFFQLVFAKTASAEPAPANSISFQSTTNHNGDLGYNYWLGNNLGGNGGFPAKILSENAFEFNLRWGTESLNTLPMTAFYAQQYDPTVSRSGALSYYFSLNSLDKKVSFLDAKGSGSYSTPSISYSYQRIAWTENFIEYKIDQSQIADMFGRNQFGFGLDYSQPPTEAFFKMQSSCATPNACEMKMNLTAQATRLSDPATPNDGKSKNQPLAGLDENGQKLKAFENASNVDISGSDYKFAMPGQISSTVGTLGGLFTTLMSSNSGSCVLTSYVPWVSPLGTQAFGRIVNTNFCPNVDFTGSVLDYARQFSVFVVAFIFAFAIYGIARFLFSEAEEWGTPQSGGK